jgi:putative transposase
MLLQRTAGGEPFMTIDFKGAHYHELEEILAELGVSVDHATLNRWAVKYSPLIAAKAQAKK